MTHFCCNVTSAHLNPKPVSWTRFGGYASLVTAVALVVFAACLANGIFTPGVQAHVANYFAASVTVFSLLPFAVAASILTQNESLSYEVINV